MKRTVAALIAVLGLAVLPLTTAHAGPPTDTDSVHGPRCGDITADAHYTDAHTGSPTMHGTIDTASPSCSRLTYSMRLYTEGGGLFDTTSVSGDGVTDYFELQSTAATDEFVCVSFVSTDPNGRVVDSAPDLPDLGCVIGARSQLNGGTGATGMR